jgi:flagellar biosynthesis/type III secretory pathway M-ring protein FliF/YscJ
MRFLNFGRAERGTMNPKRKALALFIILFISLNIFSMVVSAQDSPPTLTKGNVTPRKSYPNIDYTFTVTYTDHDNEAPTAIRVFIDGESYDMAEVDPQDRNYTDGKDYSFKKVMDEGSYTVYYSADYGSGKTVESTSFTLSVTWDVGHYDIIHFIEEDVVPGVMLLLVVLIVLMVIFIAVMIFMSLQLRRIAKGMGGKKELEKTDHGKAEDDN